MGNRYKEVLMTYVRRPFSSWPAGFCVLFGLYQLLFGWLPGGGASATSLAWGVLFLGGAVWLHFREQMVDSRRRLTPKFIWPHITVFLTLWVFLIGVCALLLLHSASLEVLDTICLLLLVFGYIGCCVATQIRVLPYLGFVALFWILASAIPAAPRPFIPTDSPAVRLAIVSLGVASGFGAIAVLGVAASLGAIAWMTRITEEHWGYVKPVGFTLYFEFSRAAGRFFEHLVNHSRNTGGTLQSKIPARIYYNAPMVHSGPLRAALHRWRHADIFQTGLLLAFVPMVVLVLVILIFGYQTHSGHIYGLLLACPFVVVLPSLLAASQWLKCWPFLEIESLRPDSRRQFIKGIFIAVAIQTLFAWLAFASAIVAIAILDGNVFRGWAILAPYYILSLLVQPFSYVLCCWILSHRRLAVLYAVGAAVVEFEIFSGFWDWEMRSVIVAAAVFGILGVILIPIVYRRWMNLEMG
ncbi:MAG: hypothetical protein ACYCUV_14825 [Phycisphaerae bacterium]